MLHAIGERGVAPRWLIAHAWRGRRSRRVERRRRGPRDSLLILDRADRAVPYTESLRLAAARPERTTLVLVGIVEHVESGPSVGWRQVGDLLALWRVMYGLRP